MPFSQNILDDMQRLANEVWREAWNDPENPPRAYRLTPEPNWMNDINIPGPAELLARGQNGEDCSASFTAVYHDGVWTLTATQAIMISHVATRVGYVFPPDSYPHSGVHALFGVGDVFKITPGEIEVSA